MKKQNKPEEELKKESVKRMKTLGKVYKQGFKQGQAEARKEFLDKLNKFIELHWICFGDDYGYIKSKFDEFKEELEDLK